jgi:predicted RNA-binding protein
MAWLRLGELREVVEAAEADSPLLVEVARELSKTREVQIDVDSLIRLARGR